MVAELAGAGPSGFTLGRKGEHQWRPHSAPSGGKARKEEPTETSSLHNWGNLCVCFGGIPRQKTPEQRGTRGLADAGGSRAEIRRYGSSQTPVLLKRRQDSCPAVVPPRYQMRHPFSTCSESSAFSQGHLPSQESTPRGRTGREMDCGPGWRRLKLPEEALTFLPVFAHRTARAGNRLKRERERESETALRRAPARTVLTGCAEPVGKYTLQQKRVLRIGLKDFWVTGEAATNGISLNSSISNNRPTHTACLCPSLLAWASMNNVLDFPLPHPSLDTAPRITRLLSDTLLTAESGLTTLQNSLVIQGR